jgi:Fe-S cluster biogenesis protein NfuA
MSGKAEAVEKVVREVLAPLVARDGGELYLVSIAEKAVSLHLGGRFSGCPGNALARRHVIEPLIHAVDPDTRVSMSSGALVPSGATRL